MQKRLETKCFQPFLIAASRTGGKGGAADRKTVKPTVTP